jgi:hypothetical protein
LKSTTTIDDIRRRYGGWTAMSIHLGADLYTLPPAADSRLRRILQVASDLAGKRLAELRVLDLACLEGHYGIEFALHGAEVVGIELRDANLAKAQFARDHLGLQRLELVKDDVRNISVEKYGLFDVVICSGILYHLDAPDVFRFVRRMYEVCSRLAVIDTQIALHPGVSVEFEGAVYHGMWHQEHDESADADTKMKDLHASVENTRSFVLTPPSLANLIANAGFSSFYECLNPHHDLPSDRRAYCAIKGSQAQVLSSPPTQALRLRPKSEQPLPPIFQPRGRVFLFFKRILPQPLKDVFKPVLRLFRILPPDTTPRWRKS